MREFWTWHDKPTTPGMTLIVTLGGFLDAGGGASALAAHILASCPAHRVGGFDPDALFVYTGARGYAQIDDGRIVGVLAPGLEMHQVTDSLGAPFLLLAGAEPDLSWGRFAGTIDAICTDLDVRQVVYTGGVEWATSHTRPVSIIGQGTNPLVTSRYPLPAPTMRVPASATAFMEMAAAGDHRHVTGLYAKVPTYLAGSAYGPAIGALLSAIEAVSGVSVPTTGLDGAREHARLAEKMTQSRPFAAMIEALENAPQDETSTGTDDADLVAQIESFLAEN